MAGVFRRPPPRPPARRFAPTSPAVAAPASLLRRPVRPVPRAAVLPPPRATTIPTLTPTGPSPIWAVPRRMPRTEADDATTRDRARHRPAWAPTVVVAAPDASILWQPRRATWRPETRHRLAHLWIPTLTPAAPDTSLAIHVAPPRAVYIRTRSPHRRVVVLPSGFFQDLLDSYPPVVPARLKLERFRRPWEMPRKTGPVLLFGPTVASTAAEAAQVVGILLYETQIEIAYESEGALVYEIEHAPLFATD